MTSLFTEINSNHSRNNIMAIWAARPHGAPDGHVVHGLVYESILNIHAWSDNLPGQDNRKLLLLKQATLLNQWKNR